MPHLHRLLHQGWALIAPAHWWPIIDARVISTLGRRVEILDFIWYLVFTMRWYDQPLKHWEIWIPFALAGRSWILKSLRDLLIIISNFFLITGNCLSLPLSLWFQIIFWLYNHLCHIVASTALKMCPLITWKASYNLANPFNHRFNRQLTFINYCMPDSMSKKCLKLRGLNHNHQYRSFFQGILLHDCLCII